MKKSLTIVLLTLTMLSAPGSQSGKVEFSLLRIERTNENRAFGVFSFRHTVKPKLRVFGFGPPVNEVFFPWYVQYQTHTNGEWRTGDRIYSCGMIASHPLRSDQPYLLHIGLAGIPKSGLCRVGIKTENPDVDYWSAPFTLSEFEGLTR